MTRTIDNCLPKKLRGTICGLLLVFCILCVSSRAHAGGAPAPKEYQVKAALLLNFAQFIQWPAAALPTPEAPIVVGILGEDPFGNMLEQAFQDESIDGRKLEIKRSRQIDDLKSCQMLFISKSENARLAEVLASLKDQGIVTIGEVDQFGERGGIINFYLEAGKVRFEINSDMAQRRGLKINAQLLKRAKIIGSEPGKGAR